MYGRTTKNHNVIIRTVDAFWELKGITSQCESYVSARQGRSTALSCNCSLRNLTDTNTYCDLNGFWNGRASRVYVARWCTVWESEYRMSELDIGLGYWLFTSLGNMPLISCSGDWVVVKLATVVVILLLDYCYILFRICLCLSYICYPFMLQKLKSLYN